MNLAEWPKSEPVQNKKEEPGEEKLVIPEGKLTDEFIEKLLAQKNSEGPKVKVINKTTGMTQEGLEWQQRHFLHRKKVKK